MTWAHSGPPEGHNPYRGAEEQQFESRLQGYNQKSFSLYNIIKGIKIACVGKGSTDFKTHRSTS